MMQSVRERVPELAVLKTLGFSDTKVLTLIFLEAVALCVVAALTGLGLARLAFGFMGTLFGALSPPMVVIEAGVGIALLLAVLSGLPPAWASTRSTSSTHWPDDRGVVMSLISQVTAVVAMNLRSLPQRLGTSLVIIIGSGGVVAVLVSVLAMAAG